jgi:hypothetical protein
VVEQTQKTTFGWVPSNFKPWRHFWECRTAEPENATAPDPARAIAISRCGYGVLQASIIALSLADKLRQRSSFLLVVLLRSGGGNCRVSGRFTHPESMAVEQQITEIIWDGFMSFALEAYTGRNSPTN